MKTAELAVAVRERLSGDAAAKYLGLSRSTLEKMRSQGRGPRYIRLGGRCFYRVPDLIAYIDSVTIETEDSRAK